MNRKSQRGQTLVIFALAFTLIVGFVGLAIDGSHDYLVRRNSQNAADAAALAATNLMSQQFTPFSAPPSSSNSANPNYVKAAHDLAATNGFATAFNTSCDGGTAGTTFTTSWVDTGACNGGTFNHKVTVNIPPTTLVGLCVTQPFNCVEVVITERIHNFVTGSIGTPITTTVTNATAYAKQGTPGSGFTGTGFQAVYLYERPTAACGAAQCFDNTRAPAKSSLDCTLVGGNCPTFWTTPFAAPTFAGIDGSTNLNPPSHQVAVYSQGDMDIKGATTICDPYGAVACTANTAVGSLGYAVGTGASIFCSPQVVVSVIVPCKPGAQTALKGLYGNEVLPPPVVNFSPVMTAPTNDCGGLVLNGEPITAASFVGDQDPADCVPTAADQFTISAGRYNYIVINHGSYFFESGLYDIYGKAPVTSKTSGTATDGIDHGLENATDFDLCSTGTSNGCPTLTAGVWIGHGKLGFTAPTAGSGGTCAGGVPTAGSQGGGGDATIVSGSGLTFRFGASSRGFVSTNEVTTINLAGPGSGASTQVGGVPVLFDMENNSTIHLDASGQVVKAGSYSGFTGLVYQTQSAGAGGVEIDPGLSGAGGPAAVTGQVLAYSLTTFGGTAASPATGRAVDFSGGYGNGNGGVLVPKSKLESVIIPTGGAGVSYGIRAPVQPQNGTLKYPIGDEQFFLKYTDEWALDNYDTYITVNGGPPIFFSQGIWAGNQPSDTLPPNSSTTTNADDQHPQRVDDPVQKYPVDPSKYPTHVKTAAGDFDWIYQGTDSALGTYYFETNGDWTWGHESDIGSTKNNPNTAEIDFTFPVPSGTTVSILMYMTDGDHCGDYVTISNTFTNLAGVGGGAPVPGGVQLIQ